MQLALIIGLGGFMGTIARYLCGQWISVTQFNRSGFPLGTIIVNLIGCFIIGLIYGWFEKQSITASDWKLMLTAGFCGGFTTFSAFAIENVQMIRDGNWVMAILYIFISVMVGIGLTFSGIALMKS